MASGTLISSNGSYVSEKDHILGGICTITIYGTWDGAIVNFEYSYDGDTYISLGNLAKNVYADTGFGVLIPTGSKVRATCSNASINTYLIWHLNIAGRI